MNIIHKLSRYLNMDQIRDVLGVSKEEFSRLREKYPEIDVEIKRGKALGIADVARKAYELAMEGDIRAIRLILKSQGGWTEKSTVDINAVTVGPNINVYLPSNNRDFIEGEIVVKELPEKSNAD